MTEQELIQAAIDRKNEREAIMIHDGNQPEVIAKREAYNEAKAFLVDNGIDAKKSGFIVIENGGE